MQDELSKILTVLENPIRRNILARITKETHYPLQLSKELGVSQQSIMKHLKVLEDGGLVKSFLEKSKKGPKRKYYKPTKQFSLRVNLNENFFNAEIQTSRRRQKFNEYANFERRYEDTIKENVEIKLKKLSELIKEIDDEIENLNRRINYLLSLKDEIFSNANSIIGKEIENYEEREILYYLVERRNFSIAEISEELRLREKEVREIFEQLQRKRLLFSD